jgi:sterol desaturase/sphingolipid hydroxylase (fatty acid hydroxylase superfamily)
MEKIIAKFTYISLTIYAAGMACEYLLSRLQKKPFYLIKDTFVNLSTGLFALYLPYMVGLYVLTLLYKIFHSFSFPIMPQIWSDMFHLHKVHWGPLILLIFGDDFCYYWYHRLSHKIRILWCIHEVHHSSEEYNFSVYFRASFLEYVFQGVFWIPMILLGFQLEDLIFQMAVNLFYQFWLHTRYSRRFPLWDLIWNVPRFHRVHHSKNIPNLDRNFSGMFILWDRLFGTFREEKEALDYGVLSPAHSQNPIKVNLFAFQNLWKDLHGARDIKQKLAYIFGPPGWRHDGTGSTTKSLQQVLE